MSALYRVVQFLVGHSDSMLEVRYLGACVISDGSLNGVEVFEAYLDF